MENRQCEGIILSGAIRRMKTNTKEFLQALLEHYEETSELSKIVWGFFPDDLERAYVLSDSDVSTEIFIITVQEGKVVPT